jgi:hypothetical protein
MPTKTPRRSTERKVKASSSTTTSPSSFETFLGGAWQAFKGDIKINKNVVVITREVTQQDSTPLRLVTTFKLDQLPAYSFAYD